MRRVYIGESTVPVDEIVIGGRYYLDTDIHISRAKHTNSTLLGIPFEVTAIGRNLSGSTSLNVQLLATWDVYADRTRIHEVGYALHNVVAYPGYMFTPV